MSHVRQQEWKKKVAKEIGKRQQQGQFEMENIKTSIKKENKKSLLSIKEKK